jgi:hypothetical protein
LQYIQLCKIKPGEPNGHSSRTSPRLEQIHSEQ